MHMSSSYFFLTEIRTRECRAAEQNMSANVYTTSKLHSAANILPSVVCWLKPLFQDEYA